MYNTCLLLSIIFGVLCVANAQTPLTCLASVGGANATNITVPDSTDNYCAAFNYDCSQIVNTGDILDECNSSSSGILFIQTILTSTQCQEYAGLPTFVGVNCCNESDCNTAPAPDGTSNIPGQPYIACYVTSGQTTQIQAFPPGFVCAAGMYNCSFADPESDICGNATCITLQTGLPYCNFTVPGFTDTLCCSTPLCNTFPTSCSTTQRYGHVTKTRCNNNNNYGSYGSSNYGSYGSNNYGGYYKRDVEGDHGSNYGYGSYNSYPQPTPTPTPTPTPAPSTCGAPNVCATYTMKCSPDAHNYQCSMQERHQKSTKTVYTYVPMDSCKDTYSCCLGDMCNSAPSNYGYNF